MGRVGCWSNPPPLELKGGGRLWQGDMTRHLEDPRLCEEEWGVGPAWSPQDWGGGRPRTHRTTPRCDLGDPRLREGEEWSAGSNVPPPEGDSNTYSGLVGLGSPQGMGLVGGGLGSRWEHRVARGPEQSPRTPAMTRTTR